MLSFKGCKPVMHSQQFLVNFPATFAAWEHRLKHLHEQVFPVKMFFFGVRLHTSGCILQCTVNLFPFV